MFSFVDQAKGFLLKQFFILWIALDTQFPSLTMKNWTCCMESADDKIQMFDPKGQ
jgi:hypothetical protein